jgi:hypothetical protein
LSRSGEKQAFQCGCLEIHVTSPVLQRQVILKKKVPSSSYSGEI